MGYYMDQQASKFEIKKENFDKALKAIKALAGEETITDGSGRHFSWVSTGEFLNASNLYWAIRAWRWDTKVDDLGNICDIAFIGEKSGDDEFLLNALAPFVEPGSFIEMRGEDGARWRWFFDGTQCIEQYPKEIVWV